MVKMHFIFELKVRTSRFISKTASKPGLLFFFSSSENSYGTKGWKMQLKASKMLPYRIPLQWLSFGKLSPDPTTIQAPTVLPDDSHSHLSAKRLLCGCRDAPLEQT